MLFRLRVALVKERITHLFSEKRERTGPDLAAGGPATSVSRCKNPGDISALSSCPSRISALSPLPLRVLLSVWLVPLLGVITNFCGGSELYCWSSEMGMDWQSEPVVDAVLLAAAASNFASYPGVVPDAAAKEFLDKFPLPVIFSTLERGDDAPGLESAVVDALERIFSTNYGAALLVYAMPYASFGLTASSPLVRRLACFAVSKLLEHEGTAAIQAIATAGVPHPLLMAVADGDEAVATAAANALMVLGRSPEGLELLFTDKGAGVGSLKQMLTSSSAMVRIRALSIAEKIFRISEAAASAVQQSGVLSVLEVELDNREDILAQINALELLQEFAATPNGAQFLATENLIARLISTIRDSTMDSLVRARAISVGARLVSHTSGSAILGTDAREIVQAIDTNMEQLKAAEDHSSDGANEQEAVLDAFGQIGSSVEGAILLLSGPTPPARLVVEAAFTGRGGIQLAGVHSLASIAGAERDGASLVLNEQAENCLRELVYGAASTAGRPPSGLIWSLFQQSPEVRIATYRLIIPLVARMWCLRELCSRKELVDLVADPHTETTKEGMDWRHAACVGLSSAVTAAARRGESFSVELVDQLDTAARRGPYLATERREARPVVITEERF